MRVLRKLVSSSVLGFVPLGCAARGVAQTGASTFWVSIFRFCTFAPPFLPLGYAAGTINGNGRMYSSPSLADRTPDCNAKKQATGRLVAGCYGSFPACWVLFPCGEPARRPRPCQRHISNLAGRNAPATRCRASWVCWPLQRGGHFTVAVRGGLSPSHTGRERITRPNGLCPRKAGAPASARTTS